MADPTFVTELMVPAAREASIAVTSLHDAVKAYATTGEAKIATACAHVCDLRAREVRVWAEAVAQAVGRGVVVDEMMKHATDCRRFADLAIGVADRARGLKTPEEAKKRT